MIELIINLGVPIALILLALIVGTVLERRHFASIADREKQLRHLPTFSGRTFPADKTVAYARLERGSVVVSVDYFKRFLAGLRRLFGGELLSYASLLDRARRESILRLKENCADADIIVNLRLETSRVFKGRRGSIGSTEMLAYGTAIKFSADQKAVESVED